MFDETPGEVRRSGKSLSKTVGLTYSLGLTLDKDGVLKDVAWEGPAFKAGLTAGVKLLAVNGLEYSEVVLKDAVTAAKTTTAPLELIVKDQDRFRVVRIDWHGGLRYPHLVRDPAQPARLDAILAAKP